MLLTPANRMFDMEPRAKSVFEFLRRELTFEKCIFKLKAFPDLVIQLLGPDVEFIEKILVQCT